MERVLDWRPRTDERSRLFQLEDFFDTSRPLRTHYYDRTAWLDQGNEGACTGFGAAHVLSEAPRKRFDVNEVFARNIYFEARKEDEYPGEDYEGSSVLGAMKACKTFGYIYAYHWATSLEEVLQAVAYYGPVEIGVNWYSGMFEPDANGILHVTGSLAGGHALCVGGIDAEKHYVRLDNSWGPEWGINGSARLSWDDLGRLLSEQGEAALPSKHRYVAV